MTQRIPIFRLRTLFTRLIGDRRGIAMVEFAMVLPLMVVLYIGGVEISQAVAVKRVVTLCASAVANITSQYTTISASTQMPGILDAANAVLSPFPSANAVVTVSLISIDKNGNATVTWSQSLNGTGRTVGQTVTLPSAFDVPNSSVILGETSYSYTPFIDYLHIGTRTIYSSVYMLPRSVSGTITLTS